jgi:4'-phosphopantetheinyl transferase
MARSGFRDEWCLSPPQTLETNEVHVWRIALADEVLADRYWNLLSDDERARAERFYRRAHRDRYVVAHGALRRIIASYVGERPDRLTFTAGEHGKPMLVAGSSASRSGIEFNLSHSADLALLAVARGRAVGVDLEQWSEETEHLEVAERFFSPVERAALKAMSAERRHVVAGFFAAWSRKEAYLKATGHGITRGLHHFDVSLEPDGPARLLGDRLDAQATERWAMCALEPGDRYSAALVVEAPLGDLMGFDHAALDGSLAPSFFASSGT